MNKWKWSFNLCGVISTLACLLGILVGVASDSYWWGAACAVGVLVFVLSVYAGVFLALIAWEPPETETEK